ncbi:hypothetical protein CHS0354_022704 [Potamilus streckersoni]|uniref:Protein phosphatase 1 regulatory subunit 16A n=1 Tax=Potamilus streckersoni TaxID=2493646 RepID=A0AAE0RT89_9BIVA|nr:hypothetical protein CHS0354_022704 [Potamilus streckersoni]
MADHSELVAEIASVEKMNTPERLKHAKKRRIAQLKRWGAYEKQLEKETSKKRKQSSIKQVKKNQTRRVKFISNIVLLEAAARNDIDEVRKLLTSGVSPDVTNEDGLTALHQCCIDDSEEMLKLLLEFGANVNAKDSELWTPLHAAATCGHVHLCRLLIEKGADLLAVNADGNMPYDICEDEVTLDYVETQMANRGITQEQIDDMRLTTEKHMLADLKKLAAEGGDLEYRDIYGATPLHIAAANGYLEVVEFLQDEHVSLHIRDNDSWMPVHAAACWMQLEVLEMLVRNGADIDAKTKNGETPFDLCEDPDIKQKILDIKDEMETHLASRSKDHPKRQKINSRGSFLHNSGTLYSSNTSLNDKPNPTHSSHHSASMRRTSMRGDKSKLFKKEAKEEALHFGLLTSAGPDDDFQDDDDKENLPATNIDDVDLIIDDYHQVEGKSQSVKPVVADRSDSNHPTPQPIVDKQVPAKKPNSNKPANHRPDDTRHRPDNTSQRLDNIAQKPASKEQHFSDRNSHTQREEKVSQREVTNSQAIAEKHQARKDAASSEPHLKNTGSTREGQRTLEGPGRGKELQPLHSSNHHSSQQTFEDNSASRESSPKTGQPVGRAPSFRKNKDAPSKLTAPLPPTGTLADLKKQRSEQHKFGQRPENTLDAKVQNMFLNSLMSSESSRYNSSSSLPAKDNNTNNRNNNNNMTHTYQNNGLRRYSSPSSTPVIEDEKFKSNCCVVM